MLRLEPKLAGMRVFGCDSEKNVYSLFSNLLPTAIHLLCDLHMKEITFKINSQDLQFPNCEKDEILANIFEKRWAITLRKDR